MKSEKIQKETMREIEIPEGIETEIKGDVITMRKEGKEISRKFSKNVFMRKEGNKVILTSKRATRKEKKNVGSYAGHIKNIIKGLGEDFHYELEICNVHFPMSVTFDKANKEIIIKNLLGEKFPRKIKVDENVNVEIKAPKIFLKSFDTDKAGQVAANLEKITKVRNRDRNKFQDGIFITKKPTKQYL